MGGVGITEGILIVQTVAFAISAIAAVFMLRHSKMLAKKRATVEVLLRLRLDSDYIRHRDHFRTLMKNEDNLAQFASKAKLDSDATMLIFRILNYHEYLATGVSEDAFDAEIYKRMAYTMCLRDWDRLHGFVTELRQTESSKTLYQEFEHLVRRWKHKPLCNYEK